MITYRNNRNNATLNSPVNIHKWAPRKGGGKSAPRDCGIWASHPVLPSGAPAAGKVKVQRGLHPVPCPGPPDLWLPGSDWRPWTGELPSRPRAHLPVQPREMVCTFKSRAPLSLWTSLRTRLQLVSGFPSVRRYNPSTPWKLNAFWKSM